jgi:hypothetical protein
VLRARREERILEVMKTNRPAPRRMLPGSPFNKNLKPLPPAETFAAQDLVTHDKYGLGTVLGVEDEVAVLVDFGPQQVRIPVPCSKLFKL